MVTLGGDERRVTGSCCEVFSVHVSESQMLVLDTFIGIGVFSVSKDNELMMKTCDEMKSR